MNKTKALVARLLVASGLGLATFAAAASPSVTVSVDGEVAPGVYGRVEIGNRPPPAVVYPQPVVIVHAPHPVPMQPVYLHVPPGHAKHWAKHCRKYNACGQPVYFVKSVEYSPEYQRRHRRDHDRDRDRGDRGHDRGHGRGR